MSRYQPLAEFLAGLKVAQWEASFSDIERQHGFALPESAYKYPAWWANQSGAGHSQTRGWRSVGWRTSALDLERKRVRFERDPSSARTENPAEGDAELRRLMKAAIALTGIQDRNELMRKALREFISREAASGLAGLGGSMPDYVAPDRRRPAA
jgi:hypothetical protein